MIKRYNTKELINSELFIKEPVFKTLEKIKENSSKKIILIGGRGIGKSVVLQTQEHQNRNTENQSIYICFSGPGVFAKPYSSSFVEHYYELVMSYNLLYYLKTTYEVSYKKEFKEIEDYLGEINQNTNNYIRHSGFAKIELQKQLKFGEITTQIIKKWRHLFHVKELTLLIDRFDWTNNRDELSQKIIQRYFYLFNKVIITADCENIDYEDLEKKGYSFFEINYGKNIEVIKKIMEANTREYNLGKEYDMFSINQITNTMYETLIRETNGNISMMLSILERMYILSNWSRKDSLEKIMQQSIEEQRERGKNIKKMSKPLKLYL